MCAAALCLAGCSSADAGNGSEGRAAPANGQATGPGRTQPSKDAEATAPAPAEGASEQPKATATPDPGAALAQGEGADRNEAPPSSAGTDARGSSAEGARALPERAALVRLARRALRSLHDALVAKDFEPFRMAAAANIRKRYDAARLERAFAKFAAKTEALAATAKLEPAFDPPPRVLPEGLLRVAGRFPTRPEATVFVLDFAFERGGWRLAGLRLRFRRVVERAPSPEEVAARLNEDLAALAAAVKGGDFAAFRDRLAASFRAENDAAALAEAFGPLREHLALLERAPTRVPRWRVAPRLDPNDELVLSAVYPDEDARVRIDARYRYEEKAWKPLGLVVKVEQVPAEETLRALVQEVFAAVRRAVKEEDPSALVALATTSFRERLGGEAFQQELRSFAEKVDVARTEGKQPIFDGLPELQQGAVLALVGHYPTDPERVVFSLRFVREEERWRLASLSLQRRRVPDQATVEARTRETLAAIADALESGDFAALHAASSKVLQAKATPEKLAQAFASLRPHAEIIRVAAAKAPLRYSPAPNVDAQGILRVEGSTQSAPRIPFAFAFLYEGDAWKLLDARLSVARPQPRLPKTEDLAALARATLQAFDACLAAKDLRPFYERLCAPTFRAQVSYERFLAAFRPFLEAGHRFPSVTGSEPTFSPAPSLDATGTLHLQGTFPLRPRPLRFALRFVPTLDGRRWRVVGIEVRLADAAAVGATPRPTAKPAAGKPKEPAAGEAKDPAAGEAKDPAAGEAKDPAAGSKNP
ncbi:MAG: hypothetical protein D6731_12935 [Planctomycetota bacterium]|nr:MAG: hypothetical protein D6731_12935 [Planctomycetota bacterium]